jgi:hypothetical protein
MIDTAQFARDLEGIIADLPGALTVGAITLSASFSSVSKSQRLTMTGDVQEMDFRVVFPIGSLNGNDVPEEGDRVIAAPPGQVARNYKVVGRVYPQGGVSVILELALDRRNPFPLGLQLAWGDTILEYGPSTPALYGQT